MWFTALDIHDACFHIYIHLAHGQFQAIRKACEAFLPSILFSSCSYHVGQHPHCLLHQEARVHEVNHSVCGDGKSVELVHHYKILLSAAYLLRTRNVIADLLSRWFMTYYEWKLHDILVSWSDQINYAFPRLPFLPQVLLKIRQERAMVILITPFWPRQFWFPNLLSCQLIPHFPIPLFPSY